MAKPISVQLYSVREAAKADFPGTLKKISDMGYVGVEIAGLHGMKATEVATILRDLGLKASSAHAGIPTPETINQIADDAAALGYKQIIGGFGPDNMKTRETVAACVEKLKVGAELARAKGLKVGFHNHEWEFMHQVDGKAVYELYLEGAPNVFSQLDVYWCAVGGADVPAVIRKWAKRLPTLHIKDGDIGAKRVHKAVGKGRLAMKPIIDAADPSVLEWLVVELDACDTDMVQAVADSYRYLVDSGLARGRK